MARIPQIEYDSADPQTRADWDALVASGHPVTNMKATLLHSPVALHAVLEWYALFDQVKPYLGERLAVLFCHAISKENACKLCTTFMRKEIIDSGEVPEALVLDNRDAVVVEFGRQLAEDPNGISDELFAALSEFFTPVQIVELTTFGAMMIVNNIFNSALLVALDDHLDSYAVHPEQVLP